MSSAEDDEDLALAIALSLQQSSTSPATVASGQNADTAIILDDTEDEEEEDHDYDNDYDVQIRRAIALSLQETSGNPSRPTERAEANVVHPESEIHERSGEQDQFGTESACISVPGLMGLDRKAMEQARLARLGKRKRDASPDQSLKQSTSKTALVSTRLAQNSEPEVQSPEDVTYPCGTVKRTIAVKYPRTNDISIDEVLQAPTLRIAVLSSFMWDADWLHKKLDPSQIKQIWVMNAKGRDVQQRWVQEMQDSGVPNLKIHFPPMDGLIHSMHSKFMLLFGEHKLRFVVSTANMTQIDWGEVANDWQPGVMENSVFLIDLPRRIGGEMGTKESLTKFGQELIYFLEQQKIPKDVINGVLKFDFSRTGHLGFVHSIGGVHSALADHRTGLARLAECIRDMHLDKVEKIKLDYAASSLGAINDSLLRRIHLAARGLDFTTASKNDFDARDDMCIYFPTLDVVNKSVGGPDCGGIISLTRQNYNANTFPRECLRDYDSTRKGMLSHNKLLFARGYTTDGKPLAWVYIGSANISESAWGGQKILKNGSMGSLNVRNWECGIVVRVPEEELTRAQSDTIPSMDVFEKVMEVPFHYPGQKYGDKQPWFFRSG